MKRNMKKSLKIFIITITVAFIATNQKNFIYKIIDNLGYDNEILKKTLLSAVITLLISVVSSALTFLCTRLKSFLSKIHISFITKVEGRTRTTMTFTPENDEYISKNVDIHLTLNPGGLITNFIIKKLGITIDIYFNPELLDIYFPDKWDTNKHETFNIFERKISVELLGEMEIGGERFRKTSHTLNEKITVKPIRIKDENTALDFVITTKRFNSVIDLLIKQLLVVEFQGLKVTCKGGL